MPTFVQRSTLPEPAEAVFAWHARPGAFERLVPPWQQVRVVERSGEGIGPGTRVVIELSLGPLRQQWVALHDHCVEGREFRDVQVSGPFAAWAHTHRFRPVSDEQSILEDHIEYRLPGGRVGELVAGRFARRQLGRMFGFRHMRTRQDLARHRGVAGRGRLRVVLTGASGLVGTAVGAFLATGGHRVERLVRRAPEHPGEIGWDPARGTIDAAALEGADAVVHLAGEPVGGRWTPERKAAIRDSRVASTTLLADTLARLARPPRALISASAIGVYGARDDDAPVDERSAPGDDFLAEVCRAWEGATAAAERAGIRVVHARIGVVLAARGGALAQMLGPFRAGAGGVVGSGRQVLSWIALDDVVGALHHLLFADGVSGAVNLVAPAPATNAELTHVLGHVLGRPTVLPLPAAAVRAVFGEMGESLLLGGVRVAPRVLAASGFRFLYQALDDTLRAELGL